MEDLNICVLMGGWSNEREISLKSGNAVLDACKRLYSNAWGLDLKSAADLDQLLCCKPDVCFVALHGPVGEDGLVQAWLELYKIPYTGSDVKASGLAMDKVLAKNILRSFGLPVLDSLVFNSFEDTCGADIKYPACLKPVSEGSSIGVLKARNDEELESHLTKLWLMYENVMVEPWIDGEDYTVGYLGCRSLPIIKIEVDSGFYDFKNKYTKGKHKKIIPCGLDEKQEHNMQMQAMRACALLGVKGFARVDFIMDKNGNWYILEVNTIPGLTPLSLLPVAAKAAGMDFDQLVKFIVDDCVVVNSDELCV